MFTPFIKDEDLLNQNPFIKNEIKFNLMHRVAEGDLNIALKAEDNNMIALGKTGRTMWLWINEDLEQKDILDIINSLCSRLREEKIHWIASTPYISKSFSHKYSELTGTVYELSMSMESYHCPCVKKPKNVPGKMVFSQICHLETVAKLCADRILYASGDIVTVESQIPSAERLINSGDLFLWMADDAVVSMANIAHRAPRHARINHVLTPLRERKKGYASALVANISEYVMKEGRVAMLYSDIKNPDSNNVYKNIGFLECGRIDRYSFLY